MSFDFDFTVEDLEQMVPNCKEPDELYEALCHVCPNYEIDTVDRLAAFVAQCGHESADFTRLKENLNYSASALVRVWPRHFNEENAQEYHRQPEKIANRAYRDRMGNDDEESGDGWRYRGRGAIQLTGYNNYNAFSEDAGMDIEDAVDYLETLEGAVESAAWFWLKNDLNEMADDRDNTAMTKRINGGTHGIEDRKERLINNLEILLGD